MTIRSNKYQKADWTIEDKQKLEQAVHILAKGTKADLML
jgi:hypothetical protein